MKSTERGKLQKKNCKIDRSVVKSPPDPNCKRFRSTEKRANFKLKPDPQMGTIFLNKRRNYIHQYNEVKEKLYPISFIYVWKTFQHQVKDMYAIQKGQVFSSLRRPETHFRHQ